jgi:hypothetical protein
VNKLPPSIAPSPKNLPDPLPSDEHLYLHKPSSSSKILVPYDFLHSQNSGINQDMFSHRPESNTSNHIQSHILKEIDRELKLRELPKKYYTG